MITHKLNLDDFIRFQDLQEEITAIERENGGFVSLEVSIESWDRLNDLLCGLRASNVSVLVLVKPATLSYAQEELLFLFGDLWRWDQLIVQNILSIAPHLIPSRFEPALRKEAVLELKCFQQWLIACHDPQIHKYPSMPWRSYIRKTADENFDFVKRLLSFENWNTEGLESFVGDFLSSKKRVLFTFPKRWGHVQ